MGRQRISKPHTHVKCSYCGKYVDIERDKSYSQHIESCKIPKKVKNYRFPNGPYPK